MNNAGTVSTNGLVAAVSWVLTASLLLLAVGLMVGGHWKAAILVAETACVSSAVAAVRHLRCYAADICHKVDELALERDIERVTGLPRPRRHSDA